jgi:leader peptidase (prepilin peptidase) / N-methyltransferase
LAPGHWSTRHGYWRAMRVFTARAVREAKTYALVALAAIGSGLITWVWWQGGPRWAALASGLAGVIVGGGLVWIVRVLASAVMHREAMGFGDVTLLAMIGAFLGWQAAIVVFFLAPLAGIVIGVARLILHGEKEIAFGPFLCLATAVVVLFWPELWSFLEVRYFCFHWKLLVVLFACLFLLVVLLLPIHWFVEWMRRGSKKSEAGSQKSERNRRK